MERRTRPGGRSKGRTEGDFSDGYVAAAPGEGPEMWTVELCGGGLADGRVFSWPVGYRPALFSALARASGVVACHPDSTYTNLYPKSEYEESLIYEYMDTGRTIGREVAGAFAVHQLYRLACYYRPGRPVRSVSWHTPLGRIPADGADAGDHA